MSRSKEITPMPVAAPKPSLTNTPEDAYSASVPESHRKFFGQFFTPVPVAELMAKWVTANDRCRTILDPAAGLGVFFRAINKIKPRNSYKFIGYDVDPTILAHAGSLLPASGRADTELRLRDYLFSDWHERYDGIICNPPYFKFQDYKNRASGLEEFRARLGMRLSGLTNIYTMFLLKAVSQLTPKGRAAFLVPFEFLNADYGTTVKRHLLESKTLRHVILFDSRENVFSNALTTSCILLLANDGGPEAVTFIDAHGADDLDCVSERIASHPGGTGAGRRVLYSDLDPDIKWRAYYGRQNSGGHKNLVTLSAYGKVVRGIATGDNDYFTFDLKKQAQFGIKDKFLLPCLTKAAHASSSFFTSSQFDRLRLKGGRVFLFNATDLSDAAVRRYVEHGEKSGVNERYLTSHRSPWHAIERRPPAPILVTVFNRAGLRFVRNEAGVRNLTCFHAVYLNLFAAAKVDLLMAYFLSDVSKEIFDDNRREYGGGLNKFEPNDLNSAGIVDLDAVDAGMERTVLSAYESYRESVLRSEPGAAALKVINSTFSSILK